MPWIRPSVIILLFVVANPELYQKKAIGRCVARIYFFYKIYKINFFCLFSFIYVIKVFPNKICFSKFFFWSGQSWW